jgi:hypothetical protein
MGLHSSVVKLIREHCKKALVTPEQLQTHINNEPCLVIFDILINMMKMFRPFSPADVYWMVQRLTKEQFALGRTQIMVIVDNAKYVPKNKNSFAPRSIALERKGVLPYPKDCILTADGIMVEGILQLIDAERFKLSRHIRKPLLDFILAQFDCTDIPIGGRLAFQSEAEGELDVFTSSGRTSEKHDMQHGETDLSQWRWRRSMPTHHTIFISSDSDVVALAMSQLRPSVKAYTFWQSNEKETFDLQVVIECLKVYTGLTRKLMMCWMIISGVDYYDVSGHWSEPPEDYVPEIKEDGKVKRRKRKREELLSAGVHYMIGTETCMDAIKNTGKSILKAATEEDGLKHFETFLVELYRHLVVRIDKEVINIPSDVTIHRLRSLFQDHTKYFFPSPDDIQVSLSQLRFCYNYWQCEHHTKHFDGQYHGLLRM